MNLQEIRERARTRYRDPRHVLTSIEQWNGHINAAYSEFLAQSDYGLEIAQETLTFAAGESTTDLPIDVHRILTVRDATHKTGLLPLSGWKKVLATYPDTDLQGTPMHFRVQGFGLRLFPVPRETTDVEVTFYESPGFLVDDDDIPIIPTHFHEALVVGAVMMAHKDDADLEGANSFERDFLRWLQRAKIELTGPRQGVYTPLPSTGGLSGVSF